jgi:acetyl esterase/lipase
METRLSKRRLLRLFLTAFLIVLGFAVLPASAAPQKTTHIYRQTAGMSPALDIYTTGALKQAPVLVYVHGGAWMTGSKSRVLAKPAHFVGNGFVFVSLDYRLVPAVTVRDQLEDVDYALEWIRRNIARFGGDPVNIHLMGHSAGAHLVSMTAIDPGRFAAAMIRRGAIRSVISNDTRSYDLPRLAAQTRSGALPPVFRKPFTGDPATWAALSPITHVASARDIPPFLIMHSGQGNPASRHAFARDFAAALRGHGTRATVLDARRYTHAQINKGIGTLPDITGAIDRFLAPLARPGRD